MLVDGCRQAAASDLLRFSSGNMSLRIVHERMVMTTKGSYLGRLRAEDVTVCKLSDGSSLDGKTPSVESYFHAGILRHRSDMQVVLHYQSPAATAICCGKPECHNFMIIPEIPFYIGQPAIVPYNTPGSKELAHSVIEAMRDHDLALLRNHGQVVVGKTFDEVIQKAGFFELACWILLHNGPYIQPIPEEGVAALRERARNEKSS